MVNDLFPRDLGVRFSQLWQHRSVPRALAALGVLGLLALGLPSTPQSQTLSALGPNLETSDAAPLEPLTFADRFAAAKDWPATFGVSAAASSDPRAARLAEYGASLQRSAKADGEQVIPQASRGATETTGARP